MAELKLFRKDPRLRRQMKALLMVFNTFYLTNGDVAWLMEPRIGYRFWEGTYLLPPGWHVADLGEVDKWTAGAGGIWRKIT